MQRLSYLRAIQDLFSGVPILRLAVYMKTLVESENYDGPFPERLKAMQLSGYLDFYAVGFCFLARPVVLDPGLRPCGSEARPAQITFRSLELLSDFCELMLPRVITVRGMQGASAVQSRLERAAGLREIGALH